MVWIFFILLIFGLLALDLGIFHKKDETVTMKASLMWTLVWVSIALLFGVFIYFAYEYHWMGLNQQDVSAKTAMIEYFTGYVIEESLSLDNIFVIALIFSYFKIQPAYQHNILFWGIIGAVFFRLIMILVGTAMVTKFDWMMYVFGGILIYSAVSMMRKDDDAGDFKESFAVRMLSKIYPIEWGVQDGRYFILSEGKKKATVLFAALVVVEFSDILFAVDSIPAIFSITKDPFIVFTSNIFAILGLRSLYFFLSNMLDKFQYLKYSLIFILLFVGIKMIAHHWIEITAGISLFVILSSFVVGIIYSLFVTREK